jgi:hypothetical protein
MYSRKSMKLKESYQLIASLPLNILEYTSILILILNII